MHALHLWSHTIPVMCVIIFPAIHSPIFPSNCPSVHPIHTFNHSSVFLETLFYKPSVHHPSTHQCINLSIHISIYPLVCMFFFICPSLYLFVCLSVNVFGSLIVRPDGYFTALVIGQKLGGTFVCFINMLVILYIYTDGFAVSVVVWERDVAPW